MIGLLASAAFATPDRGLEAAAEPPDVNLDIEAFHAVLFAAQDYSDNAGLADLATPVADVRRIGATLRERYGFSVDIVENATRATILDRLEALSQRLTERDALLVYYAGHGRAVAEEDRGYWLPADATLHSSAQWVSNDDVGAKARAMRARHVLVVVDSCFWGIFLGDEPALPIAARRVGELSRQRSRWVIASGSNEPVADGGVDGSSVFAYHLDTLLRQAPDRFVVPTALFDTLQDRVAENSRRTPQMGRLRQAVDNDGQLVLVNQTWNAAEPEPASTGNAAVGTVWHQSVAVRTADGAIHPVPGDVPLGTHEILADFGEGLVEGTGVLELPTDQQRVTVACEPRFLKCKGVVAPQE